jgi:hypothetical protein
MLRQRLPTTGRGPKSYRRPSASRSFGLDLVALTTLRLLGITRQVLTSGRFRFVISAATYTELQELRAKGSFCDAARHDVLQERPALHYSDH